MPALNSVLVRTATLATLFLFGRVTHAANASTQFEYFKDLAETRNYTLGLPVASQLTPDGAHVIFLRAAARNPVQRLFEVEVATGTERELLTPEQLLAGAEEQLSPEEKARRERARITARGFTSFQLSKDGSAILVALSGQLYVVERAGLKVTALPGTNWLDPKFSPDGRFVAACAKGELFVIEIATRDARQITQDLENKFTHGIAEFIAQEEMDRREGFWWSPDSKYLAFQQTDESEVEVRHIADPLHPEAAPDHYAYPKSGSANAKVRLGVIARDGGVVTWVHWDAQKFPYLARVRWAAPEAPLTLLVQNRAQQEQHLLEADPKTGQTKLLLRETDTAWIDLDSSSKLPLWLPGGKQFLWTTESGGAWQVQVRERDGRLAREITPKGFRYRALIDYAPADDSLYVKGDYDPRDTRVWKFPLNGGAGKVLSEGKGQFDASFGQGHQNYVETYELIDGQSGARVRAPSGEILRELRTEAEQPSGLPKVEFLRTKGKISFDAAIIRPAKFDPKKKYPVLLQVYAGPSVKRVISASRTFFPDQWMADQGYVVVRIDNRGTPGVDREWSRVIRGNLIDVALDDQIAGLKSIAETYSELDLGRVGVTGWSFGGYFAAMATIRRPDVFHAGVAGAPVITWENYDTHYTERYLGTPQENPDAYKVSSVLTYVNELRRPLLLIHGMTDDNVYFQHTLQAADALFRAGKHFELLPLLGTHMVADPNIRLRQQMRIIEFFDRHLKGGK